MSVARNKLQKSVDFRANSMFINQSFDKQRSFFPPIDEKEKVKKTYVSAMSARDAKS